MTPINDLQKLNNLGSEIGLIIGNFDGFHLAHKSLVKNFVTACKLQNLVPVALTFSPHPHVYFSGDDADYLLSPMQDKYDCLSENGVENIVSIKFSRSIQQLSAECFIKDHLFSCSNLKYIHLGHDFRLGCGKEDATDLLKNLSHDKNISLYFEDTFFINSQAVSSSLIRDLIKTRIKDVENLLGRQYSLKGKVIKGKGIGAKELLPTANLSYDHNRIIPSVGVYISRTRYKGKYYESVTNIGHNPTVNEEKKLTVETYLLFFSKNIYDEEIEVFFIDKIRGEKKFSSFFDLKKQIFKDVENTKIYFRNLSPFKLALIGKNISHSKSQMVYEKLFAQCVNYTLIDCELEKDIPKACDLLDLYQGVSITAPYKEHFSCYLADKKSQFSIVNTLYREEDKIYSTNTDSLAIRNILESYIAEGVGKIILLGDGCMSKITEDHTRDLGISCVVLSRRNGELRNINQYLIGDLTNTLVINSCSRVYEYNGKNDVLYYFWDMNYLLPHHQKYFLNTPIVYQDGMELLELQAKYALKCWNLK